MKPSIMTPRGDSTRRTPARSPMRFISVDNVLQYASEIPSGQPRIPPPRGPRSITGVRRVSGGGLPNLASRTGQHNMPSRTTRISEKLVLLPDTPEELEGDEDGERIQPEDEGRPLKDEERDVLRKRGGLRGKSYAERLPKFERAEKLSRLTAYCTAQSYKMKSTSEFLRKKHDAKTKLYDDCLYTVYHTPLLSGVDGYRVRSRPILKTPGTGKTVLDIEIERSEQRDEHMGYYDEYAFSEQGASPSNGDSNDRRHLDETTEPTNNNHSGGGHASPVNRFVPNAKQFAEMFVFSYGVVVFWNFTEQQEKAILADITFAESETGVSLVARPLEQSDFETEEFHFEYNDDVKRPRIFNDMITLLPRSDHMVRLTISHAIAQSTKLCFFEERMSETLADAQDVPKRLALTGQLNMTRKEIVKILGRLFKSRVEINLSSNILDVPNFFWDSEPTLHPLYVAIRDYLEIDPRTKVLNERCRVFLDLAEILSDSVNDSKMSAITWIVIILIIVSIFVTVTEVALRFGMLSKERGNGNGGNVSPGIMGGLPSILARSNYTLDDLRLWGASLSDQERRAVCGADYIGTTYAGI
ncbi:Sad1-interacting factor 3 [Xylariaceae sp. AK1471]|nr:Sad1-interacting factor 3 [Xylariaceae sp. AK1471]